MNSIHEAHHQTKYHKRDQFRTRTWTSIWISRVTWCRIWNATYFANGLIELVALIFSDMVSTWYEGTLSWTVQYVREYIDIWSRDMHKCPVGLQVGWLVGWKLSIIEDDHNSSSWSVFHSPELWVRDGYMVSCQICGMVWSHTHHGTFIHKGVEKKVCCGVSPLWSRSLFPLAQVCLS